MKGGDFMYQDIEMIKNGEPAKTWELDVHDTLCDCWSMIHNLMGRCLDETKDSEYIVNKLAGLNAEISRINSEISVLAVIKNPYYFK